jgi:acetate kinase
VCSGRSVTTVLETLAINAGSSSVKCGRFTFEQEPRLLARETIDGTRAEATPRLIDWIERNTQAASLAAIGHRIVHGGRRFSDPQPIGPALLATLTQLIPFAPNHLPDEIALINVLGQCRPGVPQVACFDTAFHADLPEVARRLPIPRAYDADGIRRYGFHGLSFTFLVGELQRLARTGTAAERVVLAHLGNGSSLAAVHNGRSIDTTMAFTPIGGVIMSTRSGDLDPGVVTYIARRDGLTADHVEDVLSHRSGLLGISGGTSDMRVLLEREPHDPACRLAVAMYIYSIKKAIGSLASVLGGIDAIVFSGGIGEHAPAIRSRICDGLGFLGVQLDPDSNARNAANGRLISSSAARVAVWVIPTDEETVIARAAYALFGSR